MDKQSPSSEVTRSALHLIREVVPLEVGQHVLVVTDVGKKEVGESIVEACEIAGGTPVLMVMPITEQHGSEPLEEVTAAMCASTLIFTATTHALTHTKARSKASASGARVVILRGVDQEMMIRGGMNVDYLALSRRNDRLKQLLSEANQIQVTSKAGTDVSFSVIGRKAFNLDGFFHEDTGFSVLPAGEVPTSPVEGTVNGVITFDFSMDGIGRLSEPLSVNVESGRVISTSGAKNEVAFLENLFQKDPTARNIAEFAIGTNPSARLIGNLAEDKKRLGTVHFALGDNTSLGGSVQSSIHLDGLLLEPTVIADGILIVQDGRLLIE